MPFGTLEQKVRTAEELGYESAWLVDHLFVRRQPELDILEAWTTATALLARTETIRVGHLALAATFRNPAVLAKMVATLDVVSGGRVDLGIGWGSVPEETRVFGIGDEPARTRAARTKECLEILELMFAGEQFTYRGEHYQLDGAIGRPVPVQGRVPIHIGGTGEKLTMPLVRDHADWWNCPAYGAERLAELAPLAGGKRISIQRPIGVVDSEARRAEVVEQAERRFGWWGGLVCGTPEEIVKELTGDLDAGVESFVLQFTDFGTPESLGLFAREVMPELRRIAAGSPTGPRAVH